MIRSDIIFENKFIALILFITSNNYKIRFCLLLSILLLDILLLCINFFQFLYLL